jgi:hypothetical protein
LWWYQDVDADGGLVAGPVDAGAAGLVFGDGAFDDAGADPQPPGGQQAGQDVPADDAGQVDDGAGDDAGGLDELLACGELLLAYRQALWQSES